MRALGGSVLRQMSGFDDIFWDGAVDGFGGWGDRLE